MTKEKICSTSWATLGLDINFEAKDAVEAIDLVKRVNFLIDNSDVWYQGEKPRAHIHHARASQETATVIDFYGLVEIGEDDRPLASSIQLSSSERNRIVFSIEDQKYYLNYGEIR